MRTRRIKRQCSLQLTLRILVRMMVELKLPKRTVKVCLIGTQMQGHLILFGCVVEILTKGVAFGTQLVSPPGIGKRFLQSRIRVSPERLVSARQPVAGLGIFLGGSLHLC